MLQCSSKSLEFGKFFCVLLIAIPFGCHETIDVIDPSTMPLDSYHSDSPSTEAGSSVSLEVDKSIRTFLQKCGTFHYSDLAHGMMSLLLYQNPYLWSILVSLQDMSLWSGSCKAIYS